MGLHHPLASEGEAIEALPLDHSADEKFLVRIADLYGAVPEISGLVKTEENGALLAHMISPTARGSGIETGALELPCLWPKWPTEKVNSVASTLKDNAHEDDLDLGDKPHVP